MKMMKKRYSVAGYVKLAKLWEKNKKQALEYHREYYSEKYLKIENYMLYDVYVDITGQKQIYKRPEMLRLLKDCAEGKVNCIASQTKAYLAANGQEFCYFLKLVWELNPEMEVITETQSPDDVRLHMLKFCLPHFSLIYAPHNQSRWSSLLPDPPIAAR